MGIEAAERHYATLLAAFGDLVVARTQGVPARTLARRYRASRRGFERILGDLGVGGRRPSAEDALAIANMRATLAWLDGLEPAPGARSIEGGISDEDPVVVRARAALYRRYGAVSAAVPFGGSSLDRATILGRLATEPDADRRRALFTALEPVWVTVDGDGGANSPYRRLLRASADRWATHGSTVEANAVALGMPEHAIETTLRAILGAWREVAGPVRIEPWDYWFEVGAAARRLDGRVPADRLLAINARYLAALGADPARLGIGYDIHPRPGRPPIPVAFTLGMGAGKPAADPAGAWIPRPPWVFATYAEGGLGNLLELLHESGHAIHMAAIRTRPAYLDFPESSAGFLEGTADVLGWDASEPAWQGHWLGAAAEPREAVLDRYGAVMLDLCWALFEIELHRHPDRRPNEVWTEITTDGLGIAPHPEWSWWAIRGQLIDGPGYLANYALSAIMAAAVRARIIEVRGPWWQGDQGWYAFVAEALFRAGAAQPPSALLERFLGEPLSATALLADLRRMG